MSMCVRAPTAAGMSSSTAIRCQKCWSTRPITHNCRRRSAGTATNPISRIVCKMQRGWCARSILKVATEMGRQQDGFSPHGVAHLRPLNLKAVADAIQMHESTVSRVTANKYMATNRGTFELKYFFTASIASADGGEAHSAE